MEAPILGSILLVDDLEFTSADQTGFSYIEPSPSFRIFPNPANDFLNISSKNNIQFKIINALGQTMESVQLNENSIISISTSNYSNGIYFIVNKGNFSSKFIVNH
jgi:hypothetical protein